MMDKSLSEEKVPQILLLDFHQKMGGIYLTGWTCVAWESDRKLGPFGYFDLKETSWKALKFAMMHSCHCGI